MKIIINVVGLRSSRMRAARPMLPRYGHDCHSGRRLRLVCCILGRMGAAITCSSQIPVITITLYESIPRANVASP